VRKYLFFSFFFLFFLSIVLCSKLNIPAKTYAQANANLRSEEGLLAKIIHAEAKGEPYLGKVAVGAVIINRTKNPSFPNTIAGVVYQPQAFEPVANGTINQPAGEDAKRAAREALAGSDPTGGCIYFYNPATAKSPWIWSRQIVKKIGKHNFAK